MSTIDNGTPLPPPKRSTDDTIAGRRDAERRANVVPTRDALVQPTLTLHQRSMAERDARFRAAEVAKYKDWHLRAKGKPATAEDVARHLGESTE